MHTNGRWCVKRINKEMSDLMKKDLRSEAFRSRLFHIYTCIQSPIQFLRDYQQSVPSMMRTPKVNLQVILKVIRKMILKMMWKRFLKVILKGILTAPA